MCSPPITAAADSRVKPPRNTARRRRHTCSQAVSSRSSTPGWRAGSGAGAGRCVGRGSTGESYPPSAPAKPCRPKRFICAATSSIAKGNAVQASADIDGQGQFAVTQFKAVPARQCPFYQQLQRGIRHGCGAVASGRWACQRLQALYELAFCAQCFAAGGQNVQMGALRSRVSLISAIRRAGARSLSITNSIWRSRSRPARLASGS